MGNSIKTVLLAVAGLLCLLSLSFGRKLPLAENADGPLTIDEMLMNAEKLSRESSNPFYFTQHTNLVRRELDIVQTVEEYLETKRLSSREKRTAAVRPNDREKRWPNNTVNYHIQAGAFDERALSEIAKAMREITHYTCLRFNQNDTAENRVHIQQGYGGCYSHVGMVGGEQQLGLGQGCRFKQIAIHEMLHAIGIHHEQTRPDRDDYIYVHLDRIHPYLRYNFRKYGWHYINTFGIPYDYSSVMHYGKKAFSATGDYTIETRDREFQDHIGTNPGLSLGDIRTLNYMYSCLPESCNVTDSDCGDQGFVGKDCKCWCPGPARAHPVEYCFDEDKEEKGSLDIVHECEDFDGRCDEYVRDGHCKLSPGWMMYNCGKSCQMC